MGRVRARLPVLLLAAASAIALIVGCSREPHDRREVRIAADRYLTALAHKDLGAIQRSATCVVGMTSVRGGQILRIEEPRTLALGALDSLALAAERAHRSADALWSRVGEADADSLFQVRRRLAYLHSLYRNAIRAVNLSQDRKSVV